MTITIIDNATGERIQREFTSEELAQREADLAAAEAAAVEAAAIAEQNAQATAAAIAHAKSLGFTDEMIAVMYPNLGGN
jgi:UDP-N-acetylmuramyl pentapeptide synthase